MVLINAKATKGELNDDSFTGDKNAKEKTTGA